MNVFVAAVLFIGGSILYAVVGVLVGRRLVRHHVAEGHNDVLVPLFLTAGVIYAVLLAFLVVAEWEFHDAAYANTAEEAALLVPLYRQTIVMAEEKGTEMRHAIREYTEDVINGWERFRHGQRNQRAGKDITEIFHVYSTLTPATKPRELIAAQFLQTFSDMIFHRNKRRARVGITVVDHVARRRRRRRAGRGDDLFAVHGAMLAARGDRQRDVGADRLASVHGRAPQPAIRRPVGDRTGAVRAVAFGVR
jgi:hypothetical protein